MSLQGYTRGNQTIGGKIIRTGAKLVKEIQLGTVSATGTFALFSADRAMTVEAVELLVTTTVAANDTNYWTFQLTNKESVSGSDTLLDTTSDANTTKATGGTALTNFTKTSFTLTGTTANLTLAADDTVVLTATKAASGADLVNLYVRITYVEA